VLIPNVTAGVNAVVGEGSAAKEDRPVPCRVIVGWSRGCPYSRRRFPFMIVQSAQMSVIPDFYATIHKSQIAIGCLCKTGTS